MDSNAPGARIYSLQAFRGIAVLLVVLYHVTDSMQEKFSYIFLGNAFAFGKTGLDFFFVLSGFIIYYVHRADIGNARAVARYAAKRLIRIFPIFWLVLTLKVIVNVIIPSNAKPYETELAVIIKSYLLYPQIDLPVIGVAWTLSYELLFYFAFGLAILAGRKAFVGIFGGWLVLIVAAEAARLAGILQSNDVLDFLLYERILEFLLGCLAARIILSGASRYAWAALIAGIGLFLVAAIYLSTEGNPPVFALAFGLPSALIVVGSVALEQQGRFKVPGPLVFLGDASYSIYLTHAMFVSGFLLVSQRVVPVERLGLPVTSMLMFLFAVAAGSCFYYWLERPLLACLNARVSVLGRTRAAMPHAELKPGD